MKTNWRILCAATVVMALSVAPQAMAQEDEEREGGIVGTGIVGVVTELGSIIVNGQRIVFDPQMAVSGAVASRTAAGLLPGHTVAVVAAPAAPDWRALSIRHVTPVAGPVAVLGDDTLDVLGVRVDTSGVGTTGIAAGNRVAISGFWEGDVVIATLIEPLPDTAPDMIAGSQLAEGPSGGLTIGGVRISGIVPQHIQPGDVVRVIGQATTEGLRADSLETGIFDGEVGVVQAAGYLSAPTSSGLYSLLGSGLVAYTDVPSMIDPAESTVRCGVEGQLFTALDPAWSEDVQRDWQALGCGP